MEDIVVRPIRDEEILLLCKAERDESQENVRYYQRYLNWQRQGECTFLIALLHGEMAGYVFVLHKDRWSSAANQGIPGLADLCVFEWNRNQGIGNALLEEAERIAAQDSDLLHIDVHVTADAGAAQRLYARRGYMPDGKGVYLKNQPYEASMGAVDPADLTLSMFKRLK